jgi:hypothetical protein
MHLQKLEGSRCLYQLIVLSEGFEAVVLHLSALSI